MVKTPGSTPKARAKPRAQAKPAAAPRVARTAKAPVGSQPVETEVTKPSEPEALPVMLTAAQALDASNAATIADAPAPRKKRPYNRKITPAVTAVTSEKTSVARTDKPVTIIKPKTKPKLDAASKPNPAPAEGSAVMTDVMASTKKFAEDTKAKFESAFADLNVKAKASVEKSTKALGEISDLTKGNVEALVESGKIAAKGVEAMGQDAAEYSRKNFEKATATLKSFASVKSPTEFFQLQSELMSTAFDSFAKETAKNSEAMLKLAGEVAQPISSRVSLVTEKVKSLAA
jgi:hypothetical protein